MHYEKFRLDQIQNGRLSAMTLSHVRYLVNRARFLDHYYKTKCDFSGKVAPWTFLNHRIQNGQKSTLFTSIGLISGKPCYIARLLL